MAPVPMVTLPIKITAKAQSVLFDAAKKAGYRSASDYGALLFNAAFAARVGQMRDQPVSDRELDEQVRLVLACAGQADTAAIGKAVGIPEAGVVKILDAWRAVGRELRT